MHALIHFFIKSGAFVAVLSQAMVGVSLVWDKVLLKNPGTKNLYSYVFWLGAISGFAVILVVFGYHWPSLGLLGLAFLAGVLDLVASYFYYAALKMGEASETLAIMGGFAPVATAGFALLLLSKQMTRGQLWGFALMTGGGFFMFFAEKLNLKKLIAPILLASLLFALSSVLAKYVYDRTGFVSGYVWFAGGTFAASMAMLIPPSWRRQIFGESQQDNPTNRFWYFVNRFLAGIGSFLGYYAISLTHPALVESISGVRYAVIFVGAYLLTRFRPSWLREDFGGWELATKAIGTGLVIAGVVVVGLAGGKASSGTAMNDAPAPHVLSYDVRKDRKASG